MDRTLYRDKIRGSMIGGAAGDALGYPVEFMSYREIQKRYGENGIRGYSLDFEEGMALISDDTQMSLYTANGLLYGETRKKSGDMAETERMYVWNAYKEWASTQSSRLAKPQTIRCYIYDIPELHSRRAPGTTCLNALRGERPGSLTERINMSKGCGGIMRVAPVALYFKPDQSGTAKTLEKIDILGAEIAALTHTHPLGYIPAAILTHIISGAVYGGCGETLEEIVKDAVQNVPELFEHREYNEELRTLVYRAIEFSKNTRPDEENIRALGEGWTAEETLAIAVYCSLKYCDDFSGGVIAAVNHNGDSDSTGAVAGNILGAWLGYDRIDNKWKRNLEFRKLILDMADDLCDGCPEEKESEKYKAWTAKYGER